MSDQERAEAAARVLADAVTGLAVELTGQQGGDVALIMNISATHGYIGYTWDWYWRPAGASRTTAGLLGAVKPRATRGLHAPRPPASA